MKKMRILALIMTCAMLLSSLMIIPVSAEEPVSADYTATNVVGRDITIDGVADPAEGWSTDPTLTLSAYRSTEVSTEERVEGWSVDEDPTEVKISYDADYLYLFYETNNPSGVHGAAGNSKNGKRVYLLIAPTDRDLLDTTTNTANGESIQLVLNFYEPADPMQAETVTWEGMDANGVIGSQTRENLVSQFIWTTDSASLAAPYKGYFGSQNQNTFRDFKVVYAYNPATKTQCMELRIPLAHSYKQALKTDAGATFRIGINERPYDSSDQSAGYTTAPGAFRWNLRVGTGETLNLPKIASSTPVAQNVAGKTVTVDGVMGVDEGWSAKPAFTTKYKVSNPSVTFPDGVNTVKKSETVTEARVADNAPSKLYISTDGKYIYFYYESTHSDFINTGWLNTSGGWATPAFYLHLAPADMSGSGATVAQQETFYLNIKTLTGDSFDPPVEKALTTNGVYIWDHKMGDENKDTNGGAYPEMLEGGNDVRASRYFVQAYRNTAKANVEGVSMENYGQDVRNDTHIAMRVVGTAGSYKKLCLEIAIPINETLAKKLVEGTADYRLVAYEQSNRFDEAKVVKRGGTETNVPKDAGYVLSEKTLTETNEKVDDITYGNWSFATNCGVKFTLPQTTTDKTAIVKDNTELVGFQSREGAVEGTYDVRFVAVVNEKYAIDLNNSKLGFLFGYGAKNSVQYCTKVYEELNAGNGTIRAEDYGGKYFFCFTITGLSKTNPASYTFNVKCFTQYNAAAPYEYCENPVTVTISYDSENNKAVFS